MKSYAKAYKEVPENVEKIRERESTPKYQEQRRQRRSTPEFKANKKRSFDAGYATPEGFAKHAARTRKYCQSEKGKATIRKQNRKPMQKLLKLLNAMSKGKDTQSLVRLGCFESNEHVRAHFESTMDKTWMTWQNAGRHRVGNGYRVAWQFGHKLPRSIFDQFNRNDCRKCFMPMNLFAQDAKENVELGDKLVYSDIELLALRPCWPDAAKNSLVLLKALFAGAAARAVAEGSSSSTHSAAADSEAEAQAEDSEVDLAEDSGAESEAETEAEDSEAEG